MGAGIGAAQAFLTFVGDSCSVVAEGAIPAGSLNLREPAARGAAGRRRPWFPTNPASDAADEPSGYQRAQVWSERQHSNFLES
jgi:hypothetical protein